MDRLTVGRDSNTRFIALFRAKGYLIVLGIASELLALLLIASDLNVIIYIKITLFSTAVILGTGCIMVGFFYHIRINKTSIEEVFLFYKKNVVLNESIQIIETVKYSNYEIGRSLICITNNEQTIQIRPEIIDTTAIIRTIIDRGLLITHGNPIIECGPKCELPDVEIEALSYRLIVGRKGINRAFWIIVMLSVLTLFIDFEIGSWILLAIATYWYYLIFEYHDLLFARGNLIVGSEETVSNIWKKLDIKLDIKLVIKIIVLTMVLWCVLFYFYHTTEVLIDNNHYIIDICLLIAFGMIRMCDVEKNIIIWVIVTLIISATVVVYSFYIEWNMSYSSVETDVETLLVNEKKVNRFIFEDKEYTVPYLYIKKEGDNKTDIIVHKSILGNLYARTRLCSFGVIRGMK